MQEGWTWRSLSGIWVFLLDLDWIEYYAIVTFELRRCWKCETRRVLNKLNWWNVFYQGRWNFWWSSSLLFRDHLRIASIFKILGIQAFLVFFIVVLKILFHTWWRIHPPLFSSQLLFDSHLWFFYNLSFSSNLASTFCLLHYASFSPSDSRVHGIRCSQLRHRGVALWDFFFQALLLRASPFLLKWGPW